MSVTTSSADRVQAFVYDFIRSDYVSGWTSDKDSDFINEPERAARCYDAAEYGADGKTHAEVIEDWREAFEAYLQNRLGHEYPERFSTAVRKCFDCTEAWHEKNGSLFQEIG